MFSGVFRMVATEPRAAIDARTDIRDIKIGPLTSLRSDDPSANLDTSYFFLQQQPLNFCRISTSAGE